VQEVLPVRVDRVIARIEGMLEAMGECEHNDIVLFDHEEGRILRCVLEEALEALCDKRDK